MADGQWQVWIDRGGTFTDCVAVDPSGRICTLKLLSENPAQYPDAPLEGLRRLLGLPQPPPGQPLDLTGVPLAEVRMGTTVATNALLTRSGEPTALVTTAGFADLPAIAEQDRPDIFALDIDKPELLHTAVLEVPARVTADGDVLVPLDESAVVDDLSALGARGFSSVAISLLHADRHPAVERRLRELATAAGFQQVSIGSDVSPLPRLLARTDTTIVDAYLTPVLQRYVTSFRTGLGLEPNSGVSPGSEIGTPATPRIRFMQSSGGLVEATAFSGKDAIFSGPAGGVVGMAHVAQAAGFAKVIGWDMGGTSTDVSHFDGSADALELEGGGGFERIEETRVSGVRVRAPGLNIVTVAAGGGSILHFEFGRLTVGPDSAGANPGPACYRNGGPLTVTDANLLLGRLQPHLFPAIFGPNADESLDVDIVREKFAALTVEVNDALQLVGADAYTPEALAEGFIRVANENMAKPILELSVARGRNIKDYALVVFGGAGAQHACAIARSLGIRDILIHPHASLLSAWGLGHAPVQRIAERAVGGELNDESLQRAAAVAAELVAEGSARLHDEDIDDASIEHAINIRLRYQGTDTRLAVSCGDTVRDESSLREALATLHRQRFGFVPAKAAVLIESVEVECLGHTATPEGMLSDTLVEHAATARLFTGGNWLDVPIRNRSDVRASELAGPALIAERDSMIVLESGFRACLDGDVLVITDHDESGEQVDVGDLSKPDPVLLEVFHNRFMGIAGQMGAALKKTARSTNIKERLDYSCAVFDGDGGLVANAPHIPVHLGAMSEAVKHIARERAGTWQPGDAVATNDPAEGGSHLPDITVISPVFLHREHAAPTFFVASRGHHADVGGITPGSMPPFSSSLDEEGVVFHNFTLASGGTFHDADVRELLATGPHPARKADDNVADLVAQLAANEAGARELARLVSEFGADVVTTYMNHVQANAAEAVRYVLRQLPKPVMRFKDQLDDGATIAVEIRLDDSRERATIDFTGTAPQLPDNLNAPRAVAVSAVLYVLRLLVQRPIPLNSGCLLPVDIIVPPGCLLDPAPGAPVSGGNVETSQRVVDVLLGALEAAAASQGTMNNFTFGNANHQYYETICGGAGATPNAPGASAVHTHMTNTRITDPETLERNFPVRLRSFSIRGGSGGNGTHRGGDGIVREFEFLESMKVILLSQRRTVSPWGLAGGQPGHPGAAQLRRADGSEDELPGRVSVDVVAGDRVVIHTPGGGGWGAG